MEWTTIYPFSEGVSMLLWRAGMFDISRIAGGDVSLLVWNRAKEDAVNFSQVPCKFQVDRRLQNFTGRWWVRWPMTGEQPVEFERDGHRLARYLDKERNPWCELFSTEITIAIPIVTVLDNPHFLEQRYPWPNCLNAWGTNRLFVPV